MNTEQLRVSANENKRTFTIDKDGTKYETFPMEPVEFEDAWFNTEIDWKNFLKTSEEYKVIN